MLYIRWCGQIDMYQVGIITEDGEFDVLSSHKTLAEVKKFYNNTKMYVLPEIVIF